MIAVVHERYVEDEPSEDEHHCVQVLDLWFLDDGRYHQVAGNDHNQYWNDKWNLVGPRVVGFGVTHHDQGQHRATVEDPRREAEEVDQRVDRTVQDHRTGNQRVENQSRSRCQTAHVHVRKDVQQVSFTASRETQSARIMAGEIILA